MPRALQRLHSKSHLFTQEQIGRILQPTAALTAGGHGGVKVIFTIGPACHDVETLCQILNAGATIARVDISWGDISYHIKSLQNLQLAMKKTKHMCAVMLDTSGREIKVTRPVEETTDGWWAHSETYEITEGQEVTLTAREVPSSSSVFALDYKKLSEMAKPEDVIYVSRYLQTGSDSSVYLTVHPSQATAGLKIWPQVKEVTPTDVVCEAMNHAVLQGLLTVWHTERDAYGPINNKQNELPLLSQSDKDCIAKLAKMFEIDFISLSHSREAEDIDDARAFMAGVGHPTAKIIAKIETKDALTRFKGILNKADGLMISRANLGLDVPVEKIALVQKNMISWCNMVGKPCIVTRVVDTMIHSPRPTRAEATDCANIILDGADGYVLGAETLRGKFPVETVNTVLHIGRTAEQQFDHARHYDYLMDEASLNQQQAAYAGSVSRTASEASVLKAAMHPTPSEADFSTAVDAMASAAREDGEDVFVPPRQYYSADFPYLSRVESISSSAVRAAEKIEAKLLVVFTHSGNTAQLVAKYRPKMPILTLVVPQIKVDSLSWKLTGREVARQCLLVRGVIPMLATPRASSNETLREAIFAAQMKGLVDEGDRVVVVQRIHEDFCMKIIDVVDLLVAQESPVKKSKVPHIGQLKTLSEVTDLSVNRS